MLALATLREKIALYAQVTALDQDGEIMYPTDKEGHERRDRRRTDMLQDHMDERFDKLEKLIKSGFPDGNPEEHCKVHEGYIKDAKEKEEVRLAVKKSLYSSGVWLAILTLLTALASYLGIEVRK